MRLVGWILVLLLWPTVARAQWLEASGAHFVVYAEEGEDDVRRFAEKLERFHAAMEFLTRQKIALPSPSNRLAVYVVKSQKEVRELAKSDDTSLAAFYVPRAGGSLAVVPPLGATKPDEAEQSLLALLHEYAHHFLISTSSFPMPLWFNEGAAEFFASASFEADGSMGIGLPANHRVDELFFAHHIRARDVLDTSTDKKIGSSYLGFYGKSWQLYHYLIFEPRRQGQFARYLEALTAGMSSRDAAQKVFGDLDQLEKELDEYAKRRKLLSFTVPARGLHPGPVSVRPLTPGRSAIMPVLVRLRLGADAMQAQRLLGEARTIAQRFPSDPAVLSALAAAEYSAGNDKEAIAAASAAIAIDPGQVDAYVQKGLALFRMAESADGGSGAFAQALATFAALGQREPDHPLPLVFAFRSYLAQGREPPLSAMQGLERAVALAPFDQELRMDLALEQARLGQGAAARANLMPVAFNPHGGALADEARAALARLDAAAGVQGAGTVEPGNGNAASGSAKTVH